jgi:uncharacterized membrane protein YoaK (UPF0700 family)
MSAGAKRAKGSVDYDSTAPPAFKDKAMLIREGDERPVEIDVKLAGCFAGIAGALNAAGFQAAGLFSANMTGNVSALSDRLGVGRPGATGILVSLMAAFVSGAFCSGLLIAAGRRRKIKGIYAYSILLESVLLAALGVADVTLPDAAGRAVLVLGLSFVMGLQNAATTRISDSRVRTTHVSGMATDIGLHLSSLFGGADRSAALARLRLHATTLAAFLVGGVAGVMTYLVIGGYLLIVVAFLLAAIAVPEAARARRS